MKLPFPESTAASTWKPMGPLAQSLIKHGYHALSSFLTQDKHNCTKLHYDSISLLPEVDFAHTRKNPDAQ